MLYYQQTLSDELEVCLCIMPHNSTSANVTGSLLLQVAAEQTVGLF